PSARTAAASGSTNPTACSPSRSCTSPSPASTPCSAAVSHSIRHPSSVHIHSRMRLFTTVLSAVALIAALFVGLRPVGPVPPLGQLISPTTGIWSIVRSAELPAEQSLELAGLSAAVDVRYDDRGVPHIFAQTEEDAARALGWVHARDRLFQMEMIQRAVAGTLTELVGARALPLDHS